MGVHFIGFLLGVFMAGLSAVSLWMIVGLVASVIRRVQRRTSGLMIVVYAIQTVVPLSVVVALGWLASRISFDPTAYWLGVGLTIALNAFLFLPGLVQAWKCLKAN